jgi:hypothetical protein
VILRHALPWQQSDDIRHGPANRDTIKKQQIMKIKDNEIKRTIKKDNGRPTVESKNKV